MNARDDYWKARAARSRGYLPEHKPVTPLQDFIDVIPVDASLTQYQIDQLCYALDYSGQTLERDR